MLPPHSFLVLTWAAPPASLRCTTSGLETSTACRQVSHAAPPPPLTDRGQKCEEVSTLPLFPTHFTHVGRVGAFRTKQSAGLTARQPCASPALLLLLLFAIPPVVCCSTYPPPQPSPCQCAQHHLALVRLHRMYHSSAPPPAPLLAQIASCLVVIVRVAVQGSSHHTLIPPPSHCTASHVSHLRWSSCSSSLYHQ